MMVTQCPRCQESVSVPDALCSTGGAESSAQAQCPWCLATLGANDLRSILPPSLILIGDEGTLQEPAWSEDSAGFPEASEAPGGPGLTAVATGLGVAGLGAATGLAAASELASSATDLVADESEPMASESSSEDFEPIDFGGDDDDLDSDISLAIDPDTSSSSTDQDLDDVARLDLESPTQDAHEMTDDLEVSFKDTEDESDLGEFEIKDTDHPHRSSEQDSGVLAPVMMDVNSSRRRKSGGGIKTMLAVGLGGLMSLPIVGLVLHFLGKPVPVMGDLLESYIPMKNKAVVSRTAAPVAINPQVSTDNKPIQGRSLADDMSAAELTPGVSPEDAALAELGMNTPSELATPGRMNIPGDSAGAGSATGESPELPESSGFSLPGEAMPDQPIAEAPGVADPSAELPPMNDFGGEIADGPSANNAATDELPVEAMMPNTEPKVVDEVPTDTDAMFGSAAESAADFGLPAAVSEPTFDVQAEAKRLQESVSSLSQLDANAPERDAAINDLFEGLSNLAGNASEDSIEQARPVLQAIASDMSLVKAFALATPQWVGKPKAERQTDGAVIVGKLSGTPDNPKIFLSSKQDFAVTLPAELDSLPQEIQVGLGRLDGEGNATTISLSMLQGL